MKSFKTKIVSKIKTIKNTVSSSLKNHKKAFFIWIVIVLSLLAVAFFTLSGLLVYLPSYVNTFVGSDIKESLLRIIEINYYGVTAICTIALVWIAFIKIGDIVSTNETEIILEIDRRWSDDKIVSARAVVHKIYRKALEKKHKTYLQISMLKNPILTKKPLEPLSEKYEKIIGQEKRDEDILKRVGLEICKLSVSKTKKDQWDFILLLDLLEFMDVVGYLFKENRISKPRVKALFGKSIGFNFKIFEQYIKLKELKEAKGIKNKNYYENFKHLYKEIEK